MIETERLILRPWRESDAEALFKYASDPRVSELALWPCHTSVEMSHEVIKNYFMPNSDLFAITLKESGEAVGCIGLVPLGTEHYRVKATEREVGYWIGFPLWRLGLTTEALRALIEYCKKSLDLSGLIITTDNTNTASQRVATKCGFKLIETYNFEGIPSAAYYLNLKPE